MIFLFRLLNLLCLLAIIFSILITTMNWPLNSSIFLDFGIIGASIGFTGNLALREMKKRKNLRSKF